MRLSPAASVAMTLGRDAGERNGHIAIPLGCERKARRASRGGCFHGAMQLVGVRPDGLGHRAGGRSGCGGGGLVRGQGRSGQRRCREDQARAATDEGRPKAVEECLLHLMSALQFCFHHASPRTTNNVVVTWLPSASEATMSIWFAPSSS